MIKGHNNFIRASILQIILAIALLTSSPSAWAATGSVGGKKLSRSISNPGRSTTSITGITASWPSSNGKLLKIKLDGDVVWDKKSPSGTTSITIPSSALTSNVNKKSIKAGRTRVLTLEFERNVSTTLSDYTLTIHFGSCSISAPPWSSVTADLYINVS